MPKIQLNHKLVKDLTKLRRAEIARILNIRQSTLSNRVNGKSDINLTKINQYATVLGVHLTKLIHVTEEINL